MFVRKYTGWSSLRMLRSIPLFVGLFFSAIAVFAQTDGTKKWAFLTNGSIYGSPAIGPDGTVYVGTEGTFASQSRLFAINADGSLKWQFAGPTDWIDSTPALAPDGTLYFGSWDGKLYAVNSTNGTRKWVYATLGFISSSPAVASDGTIYIGSGDRSLHAVTSAGVLKWNFPVGDWIDSSPAIGADGTVYFGSWDNNVYAVRSDGTLRWQFNAGDNVTSSPAIGADGTIYIGAANGKIFALNGATGAEIWEYLAGAGISASPVLGTDGTIYVGSIDGYFYALNRTEGTLKWRYNTGAEIYASAAIRADGTIIFGASDYNVYALNPDGSKRWSLLTGDYIDASPAIAADGTIYVGSLDKKLYSINGNGSSVATLSSWPMFHLDSSHRGQWIAQGGLAAPAILAQPSDLSVTVGQSAVFSVTTTGSPAPTYQWRKDAVDIPGATGATHTIASSGSGDGGIYSVVVTNSVSSITSSNATLAVALAPAAPAFTTQPPSQAVVAGASVTFTVAASGTPIPMYQWQKNGVNIAGANSSNYTITGVAGGDAGNYKAVATNTAGTVTSDTALLTVIVAPSDVIIGITVE